MDVVHVLVVQAEDPPLTQAEAVAEEKAKKRLQRNREEAFKMLTGLDLGRGDPEDPQVQRYEKEFVDLWWQQQGWQPAKGGGYEAIFDRSSRDDISQTVEGVRSNLDLIDAILRKISRANIDRLSSGDRSLLRLGTWEMANMMFGQLPSLEFIDEAKEIPPEEREPQFEMYKSRVIDAIVELAKRYRGEHEGANPLINAVLSDVASVLPEAWNLQQKAAEEAVAPTETPPPVEEEPIEQPIAQGA
jgi:transcription termination factor NusB